MRNSKVQFIVHAAMIAAIYVVLTYFISAFNLASGAIQVRISESLTILPYFTPAAIPGLFVGCLLANLLTGAAIYDVIFGSLATLLGAVGTYLLRKHKFLCTLAPVVSNIIIIPLVLLTIADRLWAWGAWIRKKENSNRILSTFKKKRKNNYTSELRT